MNRLAEEVIYSLITAKEHINNIKTNIIADSYYCDTVAASPLRGGFNLINYQFNNPDYSQPSAEQYNTGFRPDWRPNFNPNLHKDYYQPVFEPHQYSGGSSNRSTQPTCDNPTKGYAEQPTIHIASGRKPYSEQPVATRCPPSDQRATREYPDMNKHRNDTEQK